MFRRAAVSRRRRTLTTALDVECLTCDSVQGSSGAHSKTWSESVWAEVQAGQGKGRGVPVRQVPPSAMNPEYEYALPSHLALFGPTVLGTTASDPFLKFTRYPRSPPKPGLPLMRTSTAFNAAADSLVALPMPPAFAAAGSGKAAWLGLTSVDGAAAARRKPASQQSVPSRHTVHPCAALQHQCLRAESDDAGNTIVVAPYTPDASEANSTQSSAAPRLPYTPADSTSMLHGAETVSACASKAELLCAAGSTQHSTDQRLVHSIGYSTQHGTSETVHSGVRADAGAGAGADGPEARGAATQLAEVQAASKGKEGTIRRLWRQLDSFGEHDVFLGRFVMLGRGQRRRGGALCCAVMLCFARHTTCVWHYHIIPFHSMHCFFCASPLSMLCWAMCVSCVVAMLCAGGRQDVCSCQSA